ncbi:MAG TPA: condensation domain-containing protein, partial [Thermoanaerobaculia bacterium]|nr:condensation domain-containing protein [Thermoanaerobaculia bacterium]
MSDISQQLSDLSPEQIEFLRRRLKKALPQGHAFPPLLRIGRDRPDFPLSSTQRQLWFQDQLLHGDSLSNVGILVRAAGHLDRPLFGRSIAEIVRRHEVLRTTFVTVGQEPRQVIAPALLIPLREIDLRGLAETRREPEAFRQAAELAFQPYDLARGPLLRTALFRLAEDQSFLLVGFHHIVSDGWSFGVFVRELGAIYRALARHQPHGLPEHEIQYADFAHWQRALLETDALARQLTWWKEALAGAPPLLDLPTDRPRPPVLGSRARKEHLLVSPAVTEAMAGLADRCSASPFMVWLAAFQALLLRWAGQEDFLVGTPVASRRSKELEGLIGMFVNTLPLRARPSPQVGFRAALETVRETVLGAFANQDLPLSKLIEALRPERDPSHTVLFQELFAFQNFRLEVEELPGVRLAPLDWDVARSPFDLTLFLTEEPRGMLAAFRYNLDLFDSATVRAIADGLEALLRSILQDPERPLADLDLLGEERRRQLLSGDAGGRRLTVRGFRVQAEEVERALRGLPGVAG